jgi:hypothetical protein
MRDYVHNHSEHHEEWNRTPKWDVIISQGPFFLSFELVCASLVFYYQGDYDTFGLFIREAFGRMQNNLHSINPGLIVEALLHVPFLLLTHGPPDLLCHYIYNLACYAHLRLKNHPIYHTIMAIASALYRPDAATHLRTWICTAAQLWEDIYRGIRGEIDKNAINAYSERIYIAAAAGSGNDEFAVRQLAGRCAALRDEAAAALGESHITTLQMERKILAVQAASALYLPDFAAQAEDLVLRMEALLLRAGPRGGGGGGFGPEHWDVYRRVLRWTGCFWSEKGETGRAVACWEKCLGGPFPDESSRVWILKVLDELELAYAQLGMAAEREAVRRRKSQTCEEIRQGMIFIGDDM